MIDNEDDLRGGAEMASALLLDLGTFITGGRRPPRWLRSFAWIATLAGAYALWRWFPWLFDNQPGWAVLAAGFWGLLLIVTLGLWSAGIRNGAQARPCPRRDE